MGKVAEYFDQRQRGGRAPGAAAAERGCVAERPWHASQDPPADLEALSDLLVSTPMVQALLGPNVDVTVRVSESGRGVVFQLEPRP